MHVMIVQSTLLMYIVITYIVVWWCRCGNNRGKGQASIAVAAAMVNIFPLMYKLTSLEVLGVASKSSPYQSTGIHSNSLCNPLKLL
jgi:hypothetical protein